MQLEGLSIPIRFDESGLSRSMSSVKGMLTSFGADAAALGVVTGLGSAYVAFMVSTIEPAAEAETANVRLAAALHATGRDAEISGEKLSIIAAQLMKVSTFDDESIKAAFQTLSQFPSIPTDAFESLTKAAMDLSAATGTDLQSNIANIGRALESGIIPRSWGFSAALKEQFKAQVDAGESAGALATMMDALNQRYSGQAAAEVTTYAGQVKQLDNNWMEFKENTGSQFIPALSGLLGWVNKNFDGIIKWADAISNILLLWKGASELSKTIVNDLSSAFSSGAINGGYTTKTTTGGNTPAARDAKGNILKVGGNKASGGSAGGLTWVGERGPELVNLPGGSYVNNAQQSAAMSQIDYDQMGKSVARYLVPALQTAGIG